MIDLSKKILITGASWFIGSSFLKTLLEKWASDIIIVIRPGITNIPTEYYETGAVIRCIELDLLDRDSLFKIIQETGPQIVYHMAALWTKSIHSSNSVVDLVQANGIWTINLIDACESTGTCQAFIYLSTVYEYGPRNEPIHEEMTVEPFWEYAFSKSIGSIYAVNKWKYKKFPIAVYRLFSIYGPGDTDRIIPLMLESFLFKKTLKLYDINKKREFVYIDDLIRMLLSAEKAVALPWRVINIGSGESFTVKELIFMFEELLGDWYQHSISLEEGDSELHWIGNPTNMKDLFIIENTKFIQWIQAMIRFYLKN